MFIMLLSVVMAVVGNDGENLAGNSGLEGCGGGGGGGRKIKLET